MQKWKNGCFVTLSPQEKGREFERELADEFGLSVTPGSGNQWFAKLDLKGLRARWSLKYTEGNSFPLRRADFEEALSATTGLSGDGSISLFAVRMDGLPDDLVMMWKNDFRKLQNGELNLIDTESKAYGNAAARREKARVPVLMREDNGD